MRRLLAAALALAITVACLWFFMTPDVVEALGRAVRDARLLPLAAGFALVAVVQWLRAWRFAVMTTGKLVLPDWMLVSIAFRLNFLNFILPFRLGELSYPVLMRHHYGHGLLQSAGVLLLARVFDLATVLCILSGAAAVLRLGEGAANTTLALVSFVLGVAPFAIVLIGRLLRPRVARLPHVGDVAAKLSAGLDAIANRQAGLAAVVLGYAIWLAFGLSAVLAAASVAPSVSAAAAMLGAAAGNVTFALPINGIAGVGPAQAAWVVATTRAGVPWDEAVVSALALHGIVLTNAVVLGVVGWLPASGRKPVAPADQP
jgi:hypothetical protein